MIATDAAGLYVNGRGDSVMVRSGFSWLAALLPWFWALRHLQWRLAAVLLAATLALLLLESRIDTRLHALIELPWLVVQARMVGVRARAWQRADLVRRGYRPVAVAAPAPGAMESAPRSG